MKKYVVDVEVKTGKAQKNVKDLNKEIDKTNKEVKDTQGSLTGVSSIADKATGGMVSGFSNAVKSIKAVNLGFKSMKFAIISTGIGALVVVLGSLAAAFSSSEEGQDKFNKLSTIMGAIVGNLVDLLADLGEKLILAFETPKEALNNLSKLIKENLFNRFEGLLELIPKLGKAVKLLFEGEFEEAGKVAINANAKIFLGVENITDKVEDAVVATQGFIKEQEREAKLAGKVADMRAKADKIERKLLVDRSKLESDIALLRLKARQENEFSAEERKEALLEAQVLEDELLDRETKALKLRAAAQTQENKFSRSNKENLDKEAEARAAVNRQVAKRANVARTLQRELNTIDNQILAQAKVNATEEQKLIDDRIKKEDELFKFLSEVKPTAQEKEIMALVAKYDKAFELAQGNAEAELQLEEAQNEELAEINKKYHDKKLANIEAERVAKLASINADLDMAKQAGTAMQSLGNAVFANKMKNLKEGSKEEEEMARKQFNFNKAMQLGLAIIDTAKAVTTSLSMAPIAVGPIPNPAGIASLAFAAISGAASIASIASQKFESGSSSPVSTPKPPGAGGGGTGIGSQAPDFNVVGQSGFNQVATALGDNNSTPVKAFVVSGDVTTAQALDNNIIDTATF